MQFLPTTTTMRSTKYYILAALLTVIMLQPNVFAADNPIGTILDTKLSPSTPSQSDSSTSSPFGNSNLNKTEQTNKLESPKVETPKIDEPKANTTSNPAAQSMISNPTNPVGLAYPYQELDKSLELLKKNDIVNAKKIVQPLSEWLTEMTEYHIQLFKKLNDLDDAKNQAQIEKKIALNSALLRDKAYYQLGLIALAEKDYKKTVKYLIEVIKSQPQTELGLKSYEILQQIGFTDKVQLAP